MAYRYALVHGNAFAVLDESGALYQVPDPANLTGPKIDNPELALYDTTTGTGALTSEYLQDRTQFMQRRNRGQYIHKVILAQLFAFLCVNGQKNKKSILSPIS